MLFLGKSPNFRRFPGGVWFQRRAPRLHRRCWRHRDPGPGALGFPSFQAGEAIVLIVHNSIYTLW